MLDIHSHVLPAVDDGAKSISESKMLLEQLSSQGVNTVVATPHFYLDSDDLEEFLLRRSIAYNEIIGIIKDNNIRLILGAEVTYFSGMGEFEGIRKLTISGSNYLLLELFGLKSIDDKIIRDIVKIRENFGIVPIIAHVERYCRYRGYKKLVSAIAEGYVLCQVNASFIISKCNLRAVKKLIKSGLVNFVASDCHDPVNRPVYIKSAIEAIQRISKEQCGIIIKNTETIERELLRSYDEQNG